MEKVEISGYHTHNLFISITIIQFLLIVGGIGYVNPTITGLVTGMLVFAFLELASFIAIIPIAGFFLDWYFMNVIFSQYHVAFTFPIHVAFLLYLLGAAIASLTWLFILIKAIVD